MYHMYVRRALKKGFGRLTRTRHEAMLREFPAGFELYFPGLPAQRSPRYNLEQTLKLYARIFNLYPDLSFEVKDILVRGWPNNTRVAVEWTSRATQKDGLPLLNQGVHIFHLRWGKVIRLEIFCDTASITLACLKLEHHNR